MIPARVARRRAEAGDRELERRLGGAQSRLTAGHDTSGSRLLGRREEHSPDQRADQHHGQQGPQPARRGASAGRPGTRRWIPSRSPSSARATSRTASFHCACCAPAHHAGRQGPPSGSPSRSKSRQRVKMPPSWSSARSTAVGDDGFAEEGDRLALGLTRPITAPIRGRHRS